MSYSVTLIVTLICDPNFLLWSQNFFFKKEKKLRSGQFYLFKKLKNSPKKYPKKKAEPVLVRVTIRVTNDILIHM